MTRNSSEVATAEGPPEGAIDTQLPTTAETPAASPVYQQFCRVIREEETRLYARALGLTRNQPDARDLVQRVLERALRSLRRFEVGSNMRSWLMRILLNLFIDDSRQASRAPVLQPLEDGTVYTRPLPDDPAEEQPWTRITTEQFNAALAKLKSPFREIYEMRILEKLRYDQIAERLSIPIGTVATRLARARTKLYRLLAPQAATSAQVEEGS